MRDIRGGGFIVLFRSMAESALWQCLSAPQKVVAVTILLKASWTERPWMMAGRMRRLPRGGLFITAERLAECAGRDISEKQVRTALRRLEELGFLTASGQKGGTLISVTNWDLYQAPPAEAGTMGEGKGQAKGRAWANPIYNNKVTRKQENKGNIYKAPALSEVRDEVRRRHYTISADAFYAYYSGQDWHDKNGRPVTDWKRSLAMWQQNAGRRGKPGKQVYTMEDYARAMKGGDDNGWL